MTSMIFCIQLFTKNLIKKLNNSSAIIPIDARAQNSRNYLFSQIDAHSRTIIVKLATSSWRSQLKAVETVINYRRVQN